MGNDIWLSLEKNLRRLNPHLILESNEFEEGERHRVKTWLDIFPLEYLRRNSSMESYIYNGGRVQIRVSPPEGVHKSFYTLLAEPNAKPNGR